MGRAKYNFREVLSLIWDCNEIEDHLNLVFIREIIEDDLRLYNKYERHILCREHHRQVLKLINKIKNKQI